MIRVQEGMQHGMVLGRGMRDACNTPARREDLGRMLEYERISHSLKTVKGYPNILLYHQLLVLHSHIYCTAAILHTGRSPPRPRLFRACSPKLASLSFASCRPRYIRYGFVFPSRKTSRHYVMACHAWSLLLLLVYSVAAMLEAGAPSTHAMDVLSNQSGLQFQEHYPYQHCRE